MACHSGSNFTDERVHAIADVSEHDRDELLEAALGAEHVRPDVELVAEERFERLEQAARGVDVGEDHGVDRLLERVGRDHLEAEWQVLALDRSARAVVLEVRLDRGTPDARRPVAAHIEDGRHRGAGDRIERQHVAPLTVPDGERRVGRAEVKAEAHGDGQHNRAAPAALIPV